MVAIPPRLVRMKASRASGPGGQRTNRRSTKVQLWVNIQNLPLGEREKRVLRRRLRHHLNERGELSVASESTRSRELNRDEALRKLTALVAQALKTPRPRIPTTPPRGAENRRIREKKLTSEKKRARRESR